MDSERLKKNAAGLSLQLDEMKSRMKEEARRRDDDFAAALLRKVDKNASGHEHTLMSDILEYVY